MKQKLCIIIILFILTSVFLYACQADNYFWISPANTPTVTPTPLCPPVVFVTPERLRYESKLIVVLLEDTPQYHEYFLEAIKLMNDGLIDSVEPGDYLLMIRIGAPSLEDATLVRVRAKNIEPLAIPPTPTSHPTPRSLAISTASGSSLSQVIATQTAIAFETQTVATATYDAMEYQCAVNDWQEQYLSLLNQQQKEKQQIVLDFMNEVIYQQSIIDSQEDSLDLRVWESLGYASLILRNECDNYSRCVLIVFSAMADPRKVPPANLEVSLGKTEFLGVMLNCEYLYTEKCGQWVEFWRNNINAKSVDFINGDNVRENLLAFLRR